MEAAKAEFVEKNYLFDILSKKEFFALSDSVMNKINTYIRNEAYRSKIGNQLSTLESSLLEKIDKYEDVAQKLVKADEIISDFKKEFQNFTVELEKACTKIKYLDNENAFSPRHAAIHEINYLSQIQTQSDLPQQLRVAIDAKYDALALNDDIQPKELALHDINKHIEQEKTLPNSHISGHSQEVHRLTLELQTVRSSNRSKINYLQKQLAEKDELLMCANATIDELKCRYINENKRSEYFSKELFDKTEFLDVITVNYKKEVGIKTKLADLYKSMCDDADANALEFSNSCTELQKLYNEANNKYGDLETKSIQMKLDYEEEINKKKEIIVSLKSELEHANNLLKTVGRNEEANESNAALSHQIESIMIEYNKLKDDYSETSKMTNQYNLENKKLKGELADLERQIYFLKEENEKIRVVLSNGNYESSRNAPGTTQTAAVDPALTDSKNNLKEKLTELEMKLDEEKKVNEKLKLEIVKFKKVLNHAKSKITQLSELKNSLIQELDDTRNKIDGIVQNIRKENDIGLAFIQTEYEARLSRLVKERDEAKAEKIREVEAFVQKVNTLQRQLLKQTCKSEHQITTEKTSSELPTSNIKLEAGVAQLSDETPLASIPPMHEVGPAAPHDVHSPEHTPAPTAPSTSTQEGVDEGLYEKEEREDDVEDSSRSQECDDEEMDDD